MIANVKMLLSITDDSKDVLINYYINAVTERVKAYLNRLDIPEAIEPIIEDIVIRFYGEKIRGTGGVDVLSISSISRSGFSTSFKDISNLFAQYPELVKYRLLKTVN